MRKTQATKEIKIARSPRVLVIHAKRFMNQGGRKNAIGVREAQSPLHLTPFCVPPADHDGERRQEWYDLVAFTNHIGVNGTNGHYTAHCYNPVTKKWQEFDDAVVNENVIDRTASLDLAYQFFYVRRDCHAQPEPPAAADAARPATAQSRVQSEVSDEDEKNEEETMERSKIETTHTEELFR
jgi:ubiquitin C-terminal hydrolase